MRRATGVVLAVLALAAITAVYAAMGQGIQFGPGENPLTIHRLLNKFFAAQAKAPFRYPTACVAGTAEEYTQMAIGAGLPNAGAVQLELATVPEEFGPVEHPEPDRKSGRCEYRVSQADASGDARIIADFFSRKQPRTGEIAYAKVWQQGGDNAVLVSFPDGPRGTSPDITYKSIPVAAPLPAGP